MMAHPSVRAGPLWNILKTLMVASACGLQRLKKKPVCECWHATQIVIWGRWDCFRLFQSLWNQGQDLIASLLPNLQVELRKGESLLNTLPGFERRDIHLGDLALAPIVVYIEELGKVYGNSSSLSELPTFAFWWKWVLEDSVIRREIDAMRVESRCLIETLSGKD